MREPISSTSISRVASALTRARASHRVELFEDVLALLGFEVDVGGDEITSRPGVVQVVGGDGHLIGQDRASSLTSCRKSSCRLRISPSRSTLFGGHFVQRPRYLRAGTARFA
jgi:hypothetical protein